MDKRIKYAILQSKYRKLNKDNSDIFPSEWYNIQEYDLKIKVLSDCVDNSILITDSKYYYEFRTKALN